MWCIVTCIYHRSLILDVIYILRCFVRAYRKTTYNEGSLSYIKYMFGFIWAFFFFIPHIRHKKIKKRRSTVVTLKHVHIQMDR